MRILHEERGGLLRNTRELVADNLFAARDIQKWNGMRSTAIRVGDKIDILTEGSSSIPKVQASTARRDSIRVNKAVSYKVKKGDTLHSIASAFGVSIVELRAWNRIRGSRLRVGQALVINS